MTLREEIRGIVLQHHPNGEWNKPPDIIAAEIIDLLEKKGYGRMCMKEIDFGDLSDFVKKNHLVHAVPIFQLISKDD